MGAVLFHRFVREHKVASAPAVRASVGKRAGLTGLLCNFLLFVAKLLTGLFTGSVSIVADAANNLSDAVSSAVTLLGFHLARRPADREHPFGHARYEYLSGLVVAVLIIVIGLELIQSAINRIVHPELTESSAAVSVILAVSIGVKLWMSAFYRRLGKQINSVALLASSADNRCDAVATATVLAGLLLSRVLQKDADGWLGLAVALFVLYSGVRVAAETVSPLLGRRADPALVEDLSALLLENARVLGIHDLLVHDYGPGQCYASVHAELSAHEEPMACHALLDSLEQATMEQLGVHLVIHYDPVETDDPEQLRLHEAVLACVRQFDARLSIHDFRIEDRENGKVMLFEVAAPFDWDGTQMLIRNAAENLLAQMGKQYAVELRIDRED